MVPGAKIIVANIFQDGGLRRARQPHSSSGNNERLVAGTIHFYTRMDYRVLCVTFNNRDSCSITDQRVDISIFWRGFAAQYIGIDEHNLSDAFLLQKHKCLHQSNNEPSTSLVDVQAEHVLLQAEASLDDVARRRHEIIWRLSDQQQSVDLIRLEEVALKQMLQAENGHIRDTHALLNKPPPVVTHDFLELQRARLRKIVIPHFLDEGPLVLGNDDEHSGDALVTKS